MLPPSGNPFKCHEKVLYLQSMIPPKRCDIFPSDWEMLRRSKCVHIFLETSLTRQCLERRVLIFLQTPDCVFKKNLSASKPSEHPPSGGKCLKAYVGTLAVETKPLHGGIKRVPNVTTSGQQYNIGEKPSVILYTYINLHAGTPKPQSFLSAWGFRTTVVVTIWSYMVIEKLNTLY